MDYAIDKASGLLVDAKEALHIKKKYLCPLCYADCHLRLGSNKKPHFAHDSGKASEDCENYHPSEMNIKSLHSLRWQGRHQIPSVYICLADSEIQDYGTWKLQLLIPECPAGAGYVEIFDGYYGKIMIPVEKLIKGGYRVHVIPKIIYKIKASDSFDSKYRYIYEKPIVGLNKQYCNIFNFSFRGGRKLDEKQALFWGRAYFVVWHKDFEPQWWPRDGVITVTHLSPCLEWHCAIIKLSTSEDYQVKKWVEKILRHEIKEEPGRLSVIAPVIIHKLNDGSLQLPSDYETILSFTSKNRGDQESRICIQLPNDSLNTMTISTSEITTFITIGKLQIGRTEVWFPENPDIGLSLYATQEDINFFPQGVSLSFEQGNQKRIVAPAYSILAKTCITKLGQGSLSLADVSVPWGVSAKVRYKDNIQTIWREQRLISEYSADEELNAFKNKQFEQSLIQIIQNNKIKNYTQLEIDFGHYGKITIAPSQSQGSETYVLSHQVRKQLRWIISLINTDNHRSINSSGESIRKLESLLRQVKLKRFVSEDRLLLSHLLNYKHIPINAEIHLRNIVYCISRDYSQNNGL